MVTGLQMVKSRRQYSQSVKSSPNEMATVLLSFADERGIGELDARPEAEAELGVAESVVTSWGLHPPQAVVAVQEDEVSVRLELGEVAG